MKEMANKKRWYEEEINRMTIEIRQHGGKGNNLNVYNTMKK